MLLRFAQVVALADKDTEQGTVAERIRCREHTGKAGTAADKADIVDIAVAAGQRRQRYDLYIAVATY